MPRSQLNGAEMQIDPALLSATSALVGALMGGGATLAAAIYTQRHQDRLQRVSRETTKREEAYADFVMGPSKVLLNAYVHDGVSLNGDEQHLIGLANRMRLFIPIQRRRRSGGRNQRAYRDLVKAKR
jgi:hypothetical protein